MHFKVFSVLGSCIQGGFWSPARFSQVVPSHPEPIAWSFLETTSRADVFTPARMSFRLLKIGHRIELFQNPQLNGVLGSRAAGAKGMYVRAFWVVRSVVQGA